MNANATQDRIDELIQEITRRMNAAEQALNRHGFKQDAAGTWKPPMMPVWKGGMELKQYLLIHFPQIAAGRATLHEQALLALEEAERKRIDAFAEWMKSSMPSLKFANIVAVDRNGSQLVAAMERAQKTLDQCTEERAAIHELFIHFASQSTGLSKLVLDYFGIRYEGIDTTTVSGQNVMATKAGAAIRAAACAKGLPPTSLR